VPGQTEEDGMRRFISLAGICVGAVVLLTALTCAPANAAFKICDDSGETVAVALAFYDKATDSYISRGWWNLDDGGCTIIVSGDLTDEYYYLYAKSSQHTWSGTHTACVNQKHKFAYVDANKTCDFSWVKFFEVDTEDDVDASYTFR
jgi:uncharacterized membrane protein